MSQPAQGEEERGGVEQSVDSQATGTPVIATPGPTVGAEADQASLGAQSVALEGVAAANLGELMADLGTTEPVMDTTSDAAQHPQNTTSGGSAGVGTPTRRSSPRRGSPGRAGSVAQAGGSSAPSVPTDTARAVDGAPAGRADPGQTSGAADTSDPVGSGARPKTGRRNTKSTKNRGPVLPQSDPSGSSRTETGREDGEISDDSAMDSAVRTGGAPVAPSALDDFSQPRAPSVPYAGLEMSEAQIVAYDTVARKQYRSPVPAVLRKEVTHTATQHLPYRERTALRMQHLWQAFADCQYHCPVTTCPFSMQAAHCARVDGKAQRRPTSRSMEGFLRHWMTHHVDRDWVACWPCPITPLPGGPAKCPYWGSERRNLSAHIQAHPLHNPVYPAKRRLADLCAEDVAAVNGIEAALTAAYGADEWPKGWRPLVTHKGVTSGDLPGTVPSIPVVEEEEPIPPAPPGGKRRRTSTPGPRSDRRRQQSRSPSGTRDHSGRASTSAADPGRATSPAKKARRHSKGRGGRGKKRGKKSSEDDASVLAELEAARIEAERAVEEATLAPDEFVPAPASVKHANKDVRTAEQKLRDFDSKAKRMDGAARAARQILRKKLTQSTQRRSALYKQKQQAAPVANTPAAKRQRARNTTRGAGAADVENRFGPERDPHPVTVLRKKKKGKGKGQGKNTSSQPNATPTSDPQSTVTDEPAETPRVRPAPIPDVNAWSPEAAEDRDARAAANRSGGYPARAMVNTATGPGTASSPVRPAPPIRPPTLRVVVKEAEAKAARAKLVAKQAPPAPALSVLPLSPSGTPTVNRHEHLGARLCAVGNQMLEWRKAEAAGAQDLTPTFHTLAGSVLREIEAVLREDERFLSLRQKAEPDRILADSVFAQGPRLILPGSIRPPDSEVPRLRQQLEEQRTRTREATGRVEELVRKQKQDRDTIAAANREVKTLRARLAEQQQTLHRYEASGPLPPQHPVPAPRPSVRPRATDPPAAESSALGRSDWAGQHDPPEAWKRPLHPPDSAASRDPRERAIYLRMPYSAVEAGAGFLAAFQQAVQERRDSQSLSSSDQASTYSLWGDEPPVVTDPLDTFGIQLGSPRQLLDPSRRAPPQTSDPGAYLASQSDSSTEEYGDPEGAGTS